MYRRKLLWSGTDLEELWENSPMTAVHEIAPRASKAFFGNSHMFAVLIEIAAREDEPFSPKDIVESTGLIDSVVRPLIRRLRDAEFIEYVGRAPGEKTTLYRVRDNPWWEPARRYAVSRNPSD